MSGVLKSKEYNITDLSQLHSVQFEGILSTSIINTPNTITLGSECSIECVTKPTANANNDYYIGVGTSGSSVAFYIRQSTTKFIGQIRTSGGSILTATGTTTIVDNTTYHIAFVFSSTDGFARLYVNGIEEANVAVTGTITARVFAIGGVPTTGGNNITGFIDNARVYLRALSAAEVLDHVTGIFTDESNLHLKWLLDIGFGLAAPDRSGNNNHGVMGDNTSMIWETRLVDY